VVTQHARFEEEFIVVVPVTVSSDGKLIFVVLIAKVHSFVFSLDVTDDFIERHHGLATRCLYILHAWALNSTFIAFLCVIFHTAEAFALQKQFDLL
jgi:hypothetical protein